MPSYAIIATVLSWHDTIKQNNISECNNSNNTVPFSRLPRHILNIKYNKEQKRWLNVERILLSHFTIAITLLVTLRAHSIPVFLRQLKLLEYWGAHWLAMPIPADLVQPIRNSRLWMRATREFFMSLKFAGYLNLLIHSRS